MPEQTSEKVRRRRNPSDVAKRGRTASKGHALEYRVAQAKLRISRERIGEEVGDFADTIEEKIYTLDDVNTELIKVRNEVGATCDLYERKVRRPRGAAERLENACQRLAQLESEHEEAERALTHEMGDIGYGVMREVLSSEGWARLKRAARRNQMQIVVLYTGASKNRDRWRIQGLALEFRAEQYGFGEPARVVYKAVAAEEDVKEAA